MDQITEKAPARKIPSWLPQALGYTLSVVCLLWVLHGYDMRQLVPAIKSLDWKWVAAGVLLDLAAYLVHGWRWGILLTPVVRVRFWRTVQAIYIGLFANEVLPLRTGELIRCYLLAHWNNLRLALSFASAVLERLVDGFWMVVAFAIAAYFLKLPEPMVYLVRIMEGFVLVAGMALAYIALHRQHAHSIVRESRWVNTLRHLVEGIHSMGHWRTFGKTVIVSLLYLVVQILSVWCLMKGYLLDFSVAQAGFVLIVLRLGTVIPSAPGNLGLFQASTVAALKLLELPENNAKTFSFVMFVALTVPLLLGGAIAAALTGVNLKEIHRRAHHAR